MHDFEKKRKFLQKVYLQKTSYKIVNQIVEYNERAIEIPKNLVEHISDFENGQVYEIMYKGGNTASHQFQTYASPVQSMNGVPGSMCGSEDAKASKNQLIYILT